MKAVYYSNCPCHEQRNVGKTANKNISLWLSFISCCCWVIISSSSFLCRGSLSRSLSRCLHNNKYFCRTVKTVEQSQKQTSSFIRTLQTFSDTSEMLLHSENPHNVILHLILLYQTLYVLKLHITPYQLDRTWGLSINSLVLMQDHHCWTCDSDVSPIDYIDNINT